jgi:hypothetical protein
MGLALTLALAGCEIPKEINPVHIYRELSGAAEADRLPPPGLDRPRPNLASVPPRPERPPPEVRDAISAALAADRARSREALAARTGRARPVPGDAAWPAAPPLRPALAAAPAIPWAEPAPRSRPADPAAAPTAPAQTVPEPVALPAMPDFAPPPPPPDLLGQPRRP